MKYTLTTQPQEILPGWQSATTLVNQGPGTVYVANTGTVSAINAFPLKPTASMTWDANQPLWVVSASNSTLIAEPVAQLVNTPNVLPFDLLSTTSNVNNLTTLGTNECGSYASVRLVIKNVTQPAGHIDFTVTWMDSLGNTILIETFTVNTDLTSNLNDYLVVLPVKGTAVKFSGSMPSAAATVLIFGDNRSTRFYTGYLAGPALAMNNSNGHSVVLQGTDKRGRTINQQGANKVWDQTLAATTNYLNIGSVDYSSIVTVFSDGNSITNGSVSTLIADGQYPFEPTSVTWTYDSAANVCYTSFVQPPHVTLMMSNIAYIANFATDIYMQRNPVADGGASFLKVRVAASSTPSNTVGLTQLSVLGVNFTVTSATQKFLVTCTGTAQRGSGDTVMIGYTGIDGVAVSSQHLLSINTASAFGTLTFQDVITGLSPGAHAASYIIASNSANTFVTYGGYSISVIEL